MASADYQGTLWILLWRFVFRHFLCSLPKLQENHPDYLIRLCLRYGNLEEALEHTLRMVRNVSILNVTSVRPLDVDHNCLSLLRLGAIHHLLNRHARGCLTL